MANPIKSLSEFHLRELKESYDLFDFDKSGFISINELTRVCEILDITTDETEIKKVMNLMDKDNSGQIDFNEFVSVMAEFFYRRPTRAELETAFDYFDKDKSGFLTMSELYKVMSKFKGTITKADVTKMIKSNDNDHDNKISKSEFVAMVLNKNAK